MSSFDRPTLLTVWYLTSTLRLAQSQLAMALSFHPDKAQSAVKDGYQFCFFGFAVWAHPLAAQGQRWSGSRTIVPKSMVSLIKTLRQQECKALLVEGLDISRVQLEDFTKICHPFYKAFQIGMRLCLTHTCSKLSRPQPRIDSRSEMASSCLSSTVRSRPPLKQIQALSGAISTNCSWPEFASVYRFIRCKTSPR